MPVNDAVAIVLLNALESVYPKGMFLRELQKAIEGFGAEHSKELFALSDEGLIDAIIIGDLSTPNYVAKATISTKGRKLLAGKKDFLVVKLHEDTIAELKSVLLDAVIQSSLPKKEKGAVRKAIENAPSATVGAAAVKLVSMGIDRLAQTSPSLLDELRKLFG
jgi:hypothetical protein